MNIIPKPYKILSYEGDDVVAETNNRALHPEKQQQLKHEFACSKHALLVNLHLLLNIDN